MEESEERAEERWVFVSSIEEVKEKITNYETTTNSRFCCVRAAKNFGRIDPFAKSHNVLWRDQNIPFSGVPFFVLGEKLLECHHGKDRNLGAKKKYQQNAKKNGPEHGYTTKKNNLVQNTQKMDCPAKIYMREVMFFPNYKIPEDTERKRKSSSTRLRAAIKDVRGTSGISSERRIYIQFPDKDSHKNHILGEASGIQQQMDPRIAQKIIHLVGKGILNVNEMRRHIREYLSNDLFVGQELPPTYNRRFWPTKTDVHNHIYRAMVQNRFSKCDQTNLSAKVEEWQRQHPKDMFHFRPYAGRHQDNEITAPESNEGYKDDEDYIYEEQVKVTNTTSKQSLLFIHQTDWQRRLLERYGNSICLLDATYRTTRYSLPLFFIAVKTNVDYQVVGSFIIQHETTEAIIEALKHLKDWNPSWEPPFFMTDLSEQEINAVQEVFPGTTLYLCDFHREQAWERWVSKGDNGVSNTKQEVLCRIRRIAHSTSSTTYHDAVKSLMASQVWLQNKKLQNWFKNTWLSHHKKWAWAFRCESFIVGVNTNNGLERQNQVFKYTYLQRHKNNSLCGMLSILIEEFLPDNYNRYIEMNVKYCEGYRKYNADIPDFLVNRPRILVAHCKERIFAADDIETYHIQCVDDTKGIFKIKSQSQQGQWYRLTFGDSEKICRCECQDWQKWWLPCKHFIAVFNHYPNWQWENLSSLYQSSPFFSLDEELIKELQPSYSMAPQPDVQIPCEVPDSSQDINDVMEPLPPRNKYHRNEAAQCRDLLAQLRCATFLVHSPEALTKLRQTLSEALSTVRCHIQKEYGIEVETPQPNPKRKLHVNMKEEVCDLPPVRKKAKYSNRHGKKANENKKLTGVKLGIDTDVHRKNKKEEKKSEEEEDIIKEEGKKYGQDDENKIKVEEIESEEDESMIEEGKKYGQEDENKIKVEEIESEEQEDESMIEEKEEKCSEEDVNMIKEEEENEKKDDDIQIISVTQGTGQIEKRKKRKMDQLEKKTIAACKMLTDISINFAQILLHDQFPTCEGLEDTTLGKYLQYSVCGGEFVQILFTGQCHWISVSNIGCKRGEVNIYNSFSSGNVNNYVKKQVASIMHEEGPYIVLNIKSVQQQQNGTDCGVFAIAFLTSVLNGDDPSIPTYNNDQLRTHLLSCISDGCLTPFPQAQVPTVKRCKEIKVVTELFCTCRMPWNKNDRKKKATQMASCDTCGE